MSTQATYGLAGAADADGEFPVRFELLGEFRALCHGRVVDVGGPTAQAMLVALLHHRGRKAPRQQITDDTWGRPNMVKPDDVYHYITDLRKALAQVGVTLTSCRPGYRLIVPDHAVDAVQFASLVTSARTLRDTEPEEALDRLDRALDLWHGPAALLGIDLPGARTIARGLDARRLDVEEDLAELQLDRGRADQVLDRLRDLVSRHPERGGLAAALVRALHGTGRVEEAERRCAQAERIAQANRKPLHPKLANAADDLRAGHRLPAPARSSTVPFQLPADTSHFTGRTGELTSLLDQWPGEGEPAPEAPVVATVEGMAGIGKTALTVRAAHLLARRFDDGVLFLDLHGFTPGADPTPPEAALDTLLRGLGVPGGQIPPDMDGRVAMYRSALAHRRVLIVLDNAATETQIRPLLPSSPGCLVLLTSRRRLAGLDAAVQIALGALPATDAVTLFRAIVADRATGSDEQPIEQIVALCEHLPLAVRVAAARLRSTRAMTPAHLAAELDEELRSKRRLDTLSDGERSVAAALAVSYRHLTTSQQTVFRLLDLHPGTHLDPHALAALADTTAEDAQRLLDDLCAVSMADQPVYHRYTLHGLVRTYASELIAGDDASDRRAALTRLLDYYGHAATLAMDAVYPYEADQRPRHRPPATPTPDLGDLAAATAWLDTELDNLLAAAHAATHDRTDHTIHQSETLHRHLRTRARYADAEALHRHALEAAQAIGDRNGELSALTGLGHVHGMQGRYERATAHFERALEIARRTDHRIGELNALDGLGRVHYMRGRYDRAADHFGRALDIARQTGNRTSELNALTGLGYAHWVPGRHQQANRHFGQALDIARQTGNRTSELNALTGLGHVHLAQGHHQLAADHYGKALDIARQAGDRTGELNALNGCGHAHLEQGHHQQAVYHYQQVLDIASRAGDRNWQFEAHQGHGRVHCALGHHTHALGSHTAALDLATDLGQPDDQVRAHDGLAHAHLALGHRAHARRHWQTALTILTTLGTDYTEDPQVTTATIRAQLTALNR